MTKREARLYFRKLKQSIKRGYTNNYKKLHGEPMLRAGTLCTYEKKHKYFMKSRYMREH